jgi:hypothetical protein
MRAPRWQLPPYSSSHEFVPRIDGGIEAMRE